MAPHPVGMIELFHGNGLGELQRPRSPRRRRSHTASWRQARSAMCVMGRKTPVNHDSGVPCVLGAHPSGRETQTCSEHVYRGVPAQALIDELESEESARSRRADADSRCVGSRRRSSRCERSRRPRRSTPRRSAVQRPSAPRCCCAVRARGPAGRGSPGDEVDLPGLDGGDDVRAVVQTEVLVVGQDPGVVGSRELHRTQEVGPQADSCVSGARRAGRVGAEQTRSTRRACDRGSSCRAR